MAEHLAALSGSLGVSLQRLSLINFNQHSFADVLILFHQQITATCNLKKCTKRTITPIPISRTYRE
jgi:hypothetical protein